MADIKKLGNKALKEKKDPSLVWDFVGFGMICAMIYVEWWHLAAIIG